MASFSYINIKRVVKFFAVFLLVFASFLQNVYASDEEKIKDLKEKAIALYATQNYSEAFKILDNLPKDEKDEEVFLLLSNIALEENKDNLAIQNLNKALDKNYDYYKAYYNLGCIFAAKKSYAMAINNFMLAIKHNKTFPSAYYNLACCQIQ